MLDLIFLNIGNWKSTYAAKENEKEECSEIAKSS